MIRKLVSTLESGDYSSQKVFFLIYSVVDQKDKWVSRTQV